MTALVENDTLIKKINGRAWKAFGYPRTAEERTKPERLYLCCRGIMFIAANKILNNEHDAEDAVHQAFVKSADNLERITDVDYPKTRSYAVTIVENQAIDMYRQKSRQKF